MSRKILHPARKGLGRGRLQASATAWNRAGAWKIETSSVRGLVDAALDPVPEPAVQLLKALYRRFSRIDPA